MTEVAPGGVSSVPAQSEAVDAEHAAVLDDVDRLVEAVLGILVCHSSRATRDSRWARREPRQRWGPAPNAVWLLTARSRIISWGSGE